MSHPLPPHLADSVRIAWHISSWCNYSCDYCPVLVFHKRGKQGRPQDHAFDHYPVEQWIDAFAAFLGKDILLKITGGEPFLDRENFRRALNGVLAMPRYSIQIDTNGSWDPGYFADVDKSRLSLNVAFHPHEVDFATFFKRVRSMRDHGFHVEMLNFVMAPGNLDTFAAHLEEVERDGFFVNLSPMNPTGVYLSRTERDEREMDLIERYNVPIDVRYKVVRPGTRGRMCWQPALSYYLMFDGSIQVYCVGQFQNLFTDGPPPLPRQAVACTLNECIACTEMYRALVDEPLNTRPLSLYHRGEYVEEVKQHRRHYALYDLARKLPYGRAVVDPPVSLREQIRVNPRPDGWVPIEALSPSSVEQFVGAVEGGGHVQARSRDRIYLSGWVAPRAPEFSVKELRIRLAADELGTVRFFTPRNGGCDASWQTMVWLPALKPGLYELTVDAIGTDHSSGNIGRVAIDVRD